MLRRKNRIRRATGDQGSAIQQHCVRTISPRKAEIVYHGEDSASLSGTEPGFEKRKDLLLIDEIQMIGRLVENQNLWVLGEKLRATAYQSVSRAVFMQYFPPVSISESGSERKE